MAHEVETAVTAEAAAWWDRDGEHVFGRTMHKEEAWEAGGINWPVELVPIEYNDQETGWNLLVRGSDDKVLHCVTDAYQPLQNWDLLNYLGLLVDDSDLMFESAMSLKGGKVVAVCARTPDGIKIAGDEHVPYLTGANWHDGTRMAHIFFSAIRTECWNTLNYGMEQAPNVFRFRHTGNMEAKMAEARQRLEMGWRYIDQLKEMGEELAVQRLTMDEFDKQFLPSVLPDPKRKRGQRQEEFDKEQTAVIRTRFGLRTVCMDTPDLANHRLGKDLTRWGVLQGVVAYSDHHQINFRTPDARFEHAQLQRSEVTERAVAYLTAS